MDDAKTPPTMQLADGRVINLLTGRPLVDTREADRHYIRDNPGEMFPPTPERLRASERTNDSIRTRLDDLPGDPKRLASVGALVFLWLMGLDDEDISKVVGWPVVVVESIRGSDLFDELHARLIDNLRVSERDAAQHELTKVSREASLKVADIMRTGDSDAVRLKAAQDVLDRSGLRPADIHEHRITFEDEMRVRVIKDVKKEEIPELELEMDDGDCS